MSKVKKNKDEKNLKSYKTYFIHENGDRPYLVYIKNDVYIYRNDENIFTKILH